MDYHEEGLPVIIIMGPTASGKTQFSLDLAAALGRPCEIISVDSALIYRGMDIGTAKPSKAEQSSIPHHLIDIKEPTESYNVSDFVKDTDRLISEVHARGHIPLLVGGTMMYHTAFIHGLAQLPEANAEIREEITRQANQVGWEQMHLELSEIDPQAALSIHPNDSVRITRALEVYHLTKTPISVLQKKTMRQHHYPLYIVKVMPQSRQILHQRIEKRLQIMFEEGFVDEVRELLAIPGIQLESPAMRSVGYKQVAAFIKGDISYEEAQQKALFATRQFAKRQITWLRKYFPSIFTIYSDQSKDYIKDFKKNFPDLL